MAIHLDSTLGAGYIGNVAAAVLYGITIIQTFIFFRTCARDRMTLRIMVGILWVLDTLQLAFVTHAIYYYTVTSFDNPLALLYPTWSILGQIFVTCISDLIVRYIFGRRLWRLSGNSWLLAILVTGFSLFVFGSGMTFGIRAFQVETFARTAEIAWLFYSSLGASVITDCLIAISLCVLLLRSRTGYKRTDSLLNVLMLYSINTGMITSLCAIVCFITYAMMPNRYYYMAVFFVLSKLNINCLLASLNARSPLRDQIGLPPTDESKTEVGAYTRSIPSVRLAQDVPSLSSPIMKQHHSPPPPTRLLLSQPLAVRVDTITLTEDHMGSAKYLSYARSPGSSHWDSPV